MLIAPTLDLVADVVVNVNAGVQTIDLSGITAGENEIQPLRVTAFSDNPNLIPAPSITYTSDDSNGSLSFAPAPDLGGTATITVTVEDGGVDGDLGTAEDNQSVSRSFNVAVFNSEWQQVGEDIDGEASGDRSGISVSMSNDGMRVAIGAPNNKDNGFNAGQGRIYQWNGASWTKIGQDIDGEAAGDISGEPLAISGDGFTVAIGAWLNDGNGASAGHARIFRFDGTSWQQLGGDIDGEAAGDESGVWVDISEDGDTVAIGARKNDGNGIDAGHVRVYRWNGSVWGQLGSDIEGESPGDWAGSNFSMSADGSIIAVGSPFNDAGGTDAGHVRVFNFDGTTWSQMGSSIVGDNPNDGSFATALSEDGFSLAVGSTSSDFNGTDSGDVRVYRWIDDQWMQLGAPIPGENAGDTVGGLQLSADGNSVIFGSALSDIGEPNSGATRVFQWGGVAWEKIGQSIYGVNANDKLGWSTDISSDGRQIVVGAPLNDRAVDDIVNFGSGANAFNMQFVEIGKSGNAADTTGIPNPVGDVSYEYQIGKFEVSREMITNYNDVFGKGNSLEITMKDMDPLHGGNDPAKPVTGITWNEAARFVNWLNTSQGHSAAYKFETTGINDNISLWGVGDIGYDASNPYRNSNAVYVLPTADEWYKAAYYDPASSTWRPYASVDGNVPSAVASGTGDNTAVYNQPQSTGPAIIDQAGGLNSFGIMGMSGNVWEWEETSYDLTNISGSLNRGLRGGSYNYDSPGVLSSSSRLGLFHGPTFESADVGFRVVRISPFAADAGNARIYSRGLLNKTPTIDPIENVTIDEDAGEQSIIVSGISAGENELQPVRVTALSDNVSLISDLRVSNISPNTSSLMFNPLADQSGVSTITVTVEDGGLDGDLATAGDNLSFSRTFDVTVNAVNDLPTLGGVSNQTADEDAAEQTVNLTGISAGGGESQPLRVTASSSNTGLVLDPTVIYTSAETTGTLKFTPVSDQSGVSTITVTVEDGGLDGDLATAGDNLSFSRTFDVTVNAVNDPPVLATLPEIAIDEDTVIHGNGTNLSLFASDIDYPVVTAGNVATINSSENIATGELAGVGFTFQATNVGPDTTGRGGGVLGGTTDETYTVFSDTSFTPQLASTDELSLSATSDFQFEFEQPVTDVTLLIRGLANNRLDFFVDGVAKPFELTNSDGEFTVSNSSSSILGGSNSDATTLPDANGSLLFRGTFTTLGWTSNQGNAGDGMSVQIVSLASSPVPNIAYRIVNLNEIDAQFGLSIGMDPQSDSFALRSDNTIHVHPAANFFGSTQVVIEARDPEGAISNQQAFDLIINPINDPPVLDPASDLSLSDLIEDSGSPVGQVGSLISTLMDENGPLNNYSDIDGIAPGIAVVGKNIAIEKIWFSTDDGQSWQEAGSVSYADSLVLEADASTRLYLQPSDDSSGQLADALTIKAWDQTGGYSNGQSGVDSSAIAFSAQTDVVSISVEASPSSAADDFYSPAFDGVETLVIFKADLLANDTFGHGESIDTVTITTDAISAAGGTISVDGDQFTYTRPANWFSGIDTFGYTLDDGGSTSNATVTILSGLHGDTLTITLEPGRDHEVTLQYVDDVLVMLDHVKQETLLNIPRDLVPTTVDVIGAPDNSNIVTVNELSGSEPSESSASWSYQGGSEIDELAVLGTGSQWAWLSSDPQVENDVTVDLKLLTTSIDSYTMIAVEKVSIGQVDRVEFSDPYLEVGTQTFDLASTKPVNLPTDVTISEGILRSSMPIGLHTAKSIVGSGHVDAAFGGGISSLIRATGDLVIGSDFDSDGFRTDGRLEVGGNTVTLLDTNQASLGELTTLGDGISPGALNSDHGLAISFTGNVEGYGTIQTAATGTVINNGNIIGTSSEQPITINSRVKGVGTFDNVVMNGEFTPGFSPALWKSGTVAYTELNRFVIELGGRLAGAEFDRVEHYLAKLGGTLNVKLIDGFKPALGDLFEVITSEQPFEGDFSEVLLPLRDNGVRVRELIGQHGIELETVFDVADRLEVLKSQVTDYQIAGHDGSGLRVQGDRFRAFVTSLHQFVAEHPWHTEQLELEAGKLVQIATDGVNRLIIEGSNWKNFVEPSDVNNDQNVTALDALTVINELGRRSHSDDLTSELNDAAILVTGEGHFYDQNGDGKCTALDALRVINDLARSSVSGEGEAVPADYLTGGSPADWAQDMESYEDPFESEFEETDLIYSDADPETSYASDRPEDLVYATTGQESTEAVDSLLGDLEDWWK